MFRLFQDLILVPPFYHYEKRALLNRRKRFLPGSDTAPADAEQNLKTSAARRGVKGFFNMPKPVKGFEGKHRQRKSWIWILKNFWKPESYARPIWIILLRLCSQLLGVYII